MSEFNYTPLTSSDSSHFELNEDSPVFIFENGKSYFKAFSLQSPAKLLRVFSRPLGLSGVTSSNYSQAFCARALFLDESFNTVSVADSVPKMAPRGFASGPYFSQFEIPSNARYVVLHTNPKNFNENAVFYTSPSPTFAKCEFVSESIGASFPMIIA
jgi:hypothetical protein